MLEKCCGRGLVLRQRYRQQVKITSAPLIWLSQHPGLSPKYNAYGWQQVFLGVVGFGRGGARATPQKTCPSSNCFTPNLPHLNVVLFVLRSLQNQALDPRPSPGGNMGSTPPGWSFWILPCGVWGYSVVMRDSLALALCQMPPSPGVKRDRGNNRA